MFFGATIWLNYSLSIPFLLNKINHTDQIRMVLSPVHAAMKTTSATDFAERLDAICTSFPEICLFDEFSGLASQRKDFLSSDRLGLNLSFRYSS